MTDADNKVENIPPANASTDCKYSMDGWTRTGESGWWFYNYKSCKSVNGCFSAYSVNATFSVLGLNTFWSLMCLNAFFSVLACNSFASILSVVSCSLLCFGWPQSIIEVFFFFRKEKREEQFVVFALIL
jgi:hypothetical protein